MRVLASLTAAWLLASPASASELALTLTTSAGKPVAEAVVMLRPLSAPRPAPRATVPLRMSQKDMQFQPFILVAPVGSEVAFPNLDEVHHHVYSFSRAKTFELKLYGREASRRVRFDRPGVVGIGCNIHDDMSGFIRVVDTPFAGKSTAAGVTVLRDLPPGRATLTVWHPHLKAPAGEIAREVMVPVSGVLRVALTGDLRAPRLKHGGY